MKNMHRNNSASALLTGTLLAVATLLAGCATKPAADACAPCQSRAAAPALAHRAIDVGDIRLASAVADHYSPQDQAELLRQLRGALEEGLAAARTSAGPGEALRLDLLVTSLDEVRPSFNALTTLLLFVPLDMGGIAFEARIHDAGFPVATLAHQDRSTPLDIKGSFNRFGHARNAVRDWARGLAPEI